MTQPNLNKAGETSMAELENEIFGNGEPNAQLNKVCSDLFFDRFSTFGGNVGVKTLGAVVSLPNEEFEQYLSSLEQAPELSQ